MDAVCDDILTMDSLKKKPARKMSHEIVDSVLATAVELLNSEPVEYFTTNRVAKRAGVAIGSLYEYFRGKGGILDALVEREVGRNLREFEAGIAALGACPFEDKLNWALDVFFDRVTAKRAYLERILRVASRELILSKTHASRVRTLEIMMEDIRRHDYRFAVPDIESSLFFVINIFMDSIQTAVHMESNPQLGVRWSPEIAKQHLKEIIPVILGLDKSRPRPP